ncbi:MAG: hypothetical protein K6T85_05090 [Gorillibacterium sp.]|nr:hypothetical protein [Gorillibacterium sp.]
MSEERLMERVEIMRRLNQFIAMKRSGEVCEEGKWWLDKEIAIMEVELRTLEP